MPVSNGQVGRYDIRRGAIRFDHIRDGEIGAVKLADASISFDKIEDASYAATFTANPVANASFTTTFTTISTAEVDIPSWVGQASISAIAKVEMTNSSGGDQTLIVRIRFAGSSDGQAQNSIRDGDVGTVVETGTVNVAAPGTTVDVEVQVALDTGTNSVNQTRLGGDIIGER